MSWLVDLFSYVGPFVLLLGLLVFVHELGHFLVAKWCGVRVEVFSLGFGKKFFEYRYGETNYCLSIIPLGGYVKMFGDDPTKEISPEEQKVSFLHKKVWQRIAIVLAGPLMNLIFAIGLYTLIVSVGEPAPAPILGEVAQGSSAERAGFQNGDQILKISDQKIESWTQVSEVISENPNRELSFQVQRANEVLNLKVTPELGEPKNVLETKENIGLVEGLQNHGMSTSIGVRSPGSPAGVAGLKSFDQILEVQGEEISQMWQLEAKLNELVQKNEVSVELKVQSLLEENAEPRQISLPISTGTNLESLGIESSGLFVFRTKKDAPADLAGLQAGDRLVQINETQLESWKDIVSEIKSYDPATGALKLTYERAGEVQAVELKPEMSELLTQQGQEENRYTIGIISGLFNSSAPAVLVKAPSFFSALKMGTIRSYEMTRLMIVGIGKIITGELSRKNVTGVITIGRFAGKSFEIGLISFLSMMAFISLNLFLINLLPIPVLDGGHLLFFTIEALKGSPVSLRKMEIAQQVGLMLLLSLMAFALFNDINNLVTAW